MDMEIEEPDNLETVNMEQYNSDTEEQENHNPEDEAEEVPDPEARQKQDIKPKRVIKNPQPKLDATRLMGPRGVGILQSTFKGLKFKGKGHEKDDLNLLMKSLEHWTHRLFPKMTFDDTLKQIEKLGSKKPVQNMVKRIRLDMFQSDEVGGDEKPIEDGDEHHQEAEVIDAFDELLGSQPLNIEPDSFALNIPPEPIVKAVLTDEQREKMERNRLAAMERRKSKLKLDSDSTVPASKDAHPSLDDQTDHFDLLSQSDQLPLTDLTNAASKSAHPSLDDQNDHFDRLSQSVAQSDQLPLTVLTNTESTKSRTNCDVFKSPDHSLSLENSVAFVQVGNSVATAQLENSVAATQAENSVAMTEIGNSFAAAQTGNSVAAADIGNSVAASQAGNSVAAAEIGNSVAAAQAGNSVAAAEIGNSVASAQARNSVAVAAAQVENSVAAAQVGNSVAPAQINDDVSCEGDVLCENAHHQNVDIDAMKNGNALSTDEQSKKNDLLDSSEKLKETPKIDLFSENDVLNLINDDL